MTREPKKASRGTPKQTQLAHELKLHTYPWPRLLGEDERKWRRIAKMIDRAARYEHKRDCTGLAADGRTRLGNTPFEGRHADNHRSRVERNFVSFLEAGIPAFLTEGND